MLQMRDAFDRSAMLVSIQNRSTTKGIRARLFAMFPSIGNMRWHDRFTEIISPPSFSKTVARVETTTNRLFKFHTVQCRSSSLLFSVCLALLRVSMMGQLYRARTVKA